MYDAILVGARCAGSPTAMLLARKGYRVLLVDKATFPRDITALRGNQVETNRFLGTVAGTVSISEFFAPENLRRILSAA